MRLAINQPYLIPYAGYFRLFAASDVFVIYDDVQFPYPGWVHRNKLTKKNGELDWLTLPLLRHPLETKVKDIEFANGAGDKWGKEIRKFKAFQGPMSHLARTVSLATSFASPVDAIISTLELTRKILGLTDCVVVRSSELKIKPKLKGQARVLALCQYFGATEYVNATGGEYLYNHETFRVHGTELKILKPYEGSYVSILERLALETAEDVRKEIYDNIGFIS